jgi:hypothetical protein
MKRGDVQMTSTGTGVRHSEYNRNAEQQVHFLQIWGKPYQSRLPVRYYNRHFSDEEKTNKLVRIVAPPEDEGVTEDRDGKGPIPIHAHIRVSASILTPGSEVQHASGPKTVKTLIHNIMRSGYRKPGQGIDSGAQIAVSNAEQSWELKEGDSLYVDGKLSSELAFKSTGSTQAEFLIFEMN